MKNCKKSIFALTVMVFLLLGLFSGIVTAEEKIIELKSADVVAANSPYTIAMNEKFIPLLKQKTNGKLSVTHYPAGQLGNDEGIIEAIKLGTIDFAISGITTGKTTDWFNIPWLFKDIAHLHRVLDGEIGKLTIDKLYKETGLRDVGFVYGSSRVVTANKPIKTVADMKGLKIRVPQVAVMIDGFRALGASPTPLAFTELYIALQSGTVDAEENPYEIILNNSFYEVQKYCIETYHSFSIRNFFVNDKLWQSFSADEQKAVNEAWAETAKYAEEIYSKNDNSYKEQLKQKGMIFITPEIDGFKEATKDIWKNYIPKALGEGVYEKIQELRDK